MFVVATTATVLINYRLVSVPLLLIAANAVDNGQGRRKVALKPQVL